MAWTLSPRSMSGDLVLTRREVLQGSLAAAALPWDRHRAGLSRVAPSNDDRAVIMICNYGGVSQLETWDPKPDASSDVRGPFGAIRTTVAGVRISELFPCHARLAHHLAIVRSCYHSSPAVHWVGWQLMQTGREFLGGVAWPHMGCVVQQLLGSRGELPAHVVVSSPMGAASPGRSCGQSAGCLGPDPEPYALAEVERSLAVHDWETAGLDPFAVREQLRRCADLSDESEGARQRYGDSLLGRRCLTARRLVEAGVRFVTINTGGETCREISWDVHGTKPFRPLQQLQKSVAPMYDQSVAALVEDLAERNRLRSTLVCSLSEFGRTPRVNPAGGRDHWPRCFSVYFAGGGVQGGQVIGASDQEAAVPIDRPVCPAEIVATVYHSVGLDVTSEIRDEQGRKFRLVEPGVEPIRELF